MKTLTYTDYRHMPTRERVFVQPRKRATMLRRFQRYIETSDWDEQLIRKEHILNTVCLAAIVLSGLAMVPFLIATLWK